jgi:hypothetical protein
MLWCSVLVGGDVARIDEEVVGSADLRIPGDLWSRILKAGLRSADEVAVRAIALPNVPEHGFGTRVDDFNVMGWEVALPGAPGNPAVAYTSGIIAGDLSVVPRVFGVDEQYVTAPNISDGLNGCDRHGIPPFVSVENATSLLG